MLQASPKILRGCSEMARASREMKRKHRRFDAALAHRRIPEPKVNYAQPTIGASCELQCTKGTLTHGNETSLCPTFLSATIRM